MKLLVTGGSGLIGKYLQNELDGIYISSKDFDLTKEEQVQKMFEKFKPDTVIHLAARVGGILDNINNPFEYLEDNIQINNNVLKYSRKSGVKNLIGALSTCVYQDVSNYYPLKEDSIYEGIPNEQLFGYAYSKRVLGAHIDLSRIQGLNYSYLILGNLYGEIVNGDINKKQFLAALLEKIIEAKKLNNSSITLFGDGTPLRQFTYAKDIAIAIKLILHTKLFQNYNLGAEENLSINTMAEIALEVTNSQNLKIIYDTNKPNGQLRKDIDISKFKTNFPDFKFTKFKEGLKLIYATLEKQ